MLRRWREQRGLSQMSLALQAEISTRHLSFVETGRAVPSREMIVHLAEQLDIALRHRNDLLIAAGYAPMYRESALDAPPMRGIREAVRSVLRAHEPSLAAVVDRNWNLVEANAGVALLVHDVAPDLLALPCNVLRVSLHPRGMAPNIINLSEWRTHLLGRLRRQYAASRNPVLRSLLEELTGYSRETTDPESSTSSIAVPLRLRFDGSELSFLSTVTTFESPLDITVSELSIESFYPASDATARLLSDRVRDVAPT